MDTLLAAIAFEPFAEVRDVLIALRARGTRLVVVSNWDVSLHEVLARTGLAPLLDGAVSSAEVGAAKPDPAPIRAGLALAGARAQDAVMVGDSPEDVAAAQAAGVAAIRLDRPRTRPASPTFSRVSDAPHVSDGFPWWMPLAAFLIAIGAASIAFSILAVALDVDADSPGVTLGATFVQNTVLVVAMVVLAGMNGARVTPASFGLRRVAPRRVVGVAVGIFLVFYAFLIAWSQLDPGAEDDLATDLGADESVLSLLAVIFLTLLMAPVVEELFFRGFLFGAFRRVMLWPIAAVLAGILFGAVHLGTPAIFLVPLAVFGALLCWLYQRTGSLIPGMAVHAFNNAFALGVSLEWRWWQVIIGLVAAPLAVVLIASAVAGRDP